jgi:hypothetical protein
MDAAGAQSEIPGAALALGLAGLIPFAAGALIMWGAVPGITGETGLRWGTGYGAVILSFLGGIRWGVAMAPLGRRQQAIDFGASVASSLAGWVALLLQPIPAVSLLIAGFLLQALWDVTSAEAGRLPAWFGKLRMLLTAGAVVSLVSCLVALVVI